MSNVVYEMHHTHTHHGAREPFSTTAQPSTTSALYTQVSDKLNTLSDAAINRWSDGVRHA